jgi:hypothetical protein
MIVMPGKKLLLKRKSRIYAINPNTGTNKNVPEQNIHRPVKNKSKWKKVVICNG